jgi:hypothetical protein
MWQCNRQTGEIKVLTSYTANFELWRGISHDYLLDKQTGQTWRYFQNDTNSEPDEGFSTLPHGNPVSIERPAWANDKIKNLLDAPEQADTNSQSKVKSN